MSKAQTMETTPFLKNFVPYKPKRGEAYMNEKQREHFKLILLEWRDELMQEVDRTVHHLQDEAANYPDPADRATQEEASLRIGSTPVQPVRPSRGRGDWSVRRESGNCAASARA